MVFWEWRYKIASVGNDGANNQEVNHGANNELQADTVRQKTTSNKPRKYRLNQRITMLKLIACMAIDGYGHDPSNPAKRKNDISAKLQTSKKIAAYNIAISIDSDCINNYLADFFTKKEPEIFLEDDRNTLLKLIIGMAIDAYDYDPMKIARNTATGENGILRRLDVSKNIQNLNIETIKQESTIKGYLDEAKILLGLQSQ